MQNRLILQFSSPAHEPRSRSHTAPDRLPQQRWGMGQIQRTNFPYELNKLYLYSLGLTGATLALDPKVSGSHPCFNWPLLLLCSDHEYNKTIGDVGWVIGTVWLPHFCQLNLGGALATYITLPQPKPWLLFELLHTDATAFQSSPRQNTYPPPCVIRPVVLECSRAFWKKYSSSSSRSVLRAGEKLSRQTGINFPPLPSPSADCWYPWYPQ